MALVRVVARLYTLLIIIIIIILDFACPLRDVNKLVPASRTSCNQHSIYSSAKQRRWWEEHSLEVFYSHICCISMRVPYPIYASHPPSSRDLHQTYTRTKCYLTFEMNKSAKTSISPHAHPAISPFPVQTPPTHTTTPTLHPLPRIASTLGFTLCINPSVIGTYNAFFIPSSLAI